MKNQNLNKLAFNKVNVLELNSNQMYDINGGTSPIVTSSMPCAAAAEAAAASSAQCAVSVYIAIKTLLD